MLKLYNTLTKQVEEFIPLNPPNVGMYICGPTVYDYFHIGNARTFIMADIIRRYLEYKGYNVKFIMNLTDIDDKIIKKSIEEKIPASEVAKKYSNAFFEDIKRLKIKPATFYPKATDNIDEILRMIKALVDSDTAYNVDGNVFYNVSSFKSYGKLSGKMIDELEAGARVEVMEEKQNPLDFALWKKSKEGEPFWQSEWGNGRPGWHIECSAMSCKHLGETFDIHAGGNDLIFPHHENEIAQSEAANKKTFVKYWMHFGFLNINKEKMSKSLGNFFTAREVLEKYSAEAIRLFFAQAHYRGPVDFSSELLDASEKGLEKFKNLQIAIDSALKKNKTGGLNPDFNFNAFEKRFSEAMDEDFNSPQAVAVIFDFVKEVNRVIAEKENLSNIFYLSVKEFLEKTAQDVLGIMSFEERELKQDSQLENELIKLLIEIRLKAKLEKNFQLADEIRKKLELLGITLKDTKEGTDFFKK
ncbi:MAG: cysteine--tRNA ligase [Ignavibacteriota bacterium]|jgi:cysteinyl-tRNA synthetase|nr:cysteine--tRNA ligase [Ignavibacteriales bacterium]MBL1124255.1 cysteine--tRNA ligase [Ignavibacteriota bacterium]MCE7855876.1 cysteine--tRNA ligase [Ignavibacteria bacterium CHB3]MEB2296798.1 cysteine--tRNA ligase [Ignavibacteria bacterium]GJQ40954.1 MAG: cysteine--tRNA ligase [Ignavibacteriaceae bacterium]